MRLFRSKYISLNEKFTNQLPIDDEGAESCIVKVDSL